MKSNPIPCSHPEVVPVRKWNPYMLSFVYKCTTCHQVVLGHEEAA